MQSPKLDIRRREAHRRRELHKEAASEARKCASDFIYFCETYLYFENRHSQHTTFSPNTEQMVLLHNVELHRQVLNLKARKLGMSTMLCFYALWLAMFHHTKCALLAHDEASVKNLVRTKFRYALDHLPSFLKGGDYAIRENNMETGLVFAGGGSLRVSRNEGAAFRGGDIGFLHISEFAFLENPDKTFAAALNACLPNAIKVIETTANGLGKMHELWYGDGEAWRRLFFPWMTGPEYVISGGPDDLTAAMKSIKTPENLEKFKAYCDTYRLSVGQSLWVAHKLSENNFDWVGFHREYPAVPSLAFSTAKGRVFAISFRVGLPKQGELEFEASKFNERTSLGVDTAYGYEDGDYHAYAVMRGTREKPVIKATGYLKCPLDEWGHRIKAAGLRYNSLIVAETYGNGAATLDYLRGAGYPNLYRRRVFDKMGSTTVEKLGFSTTEQSRAILVRHLMTLFGGDNPLIPEPECPRLQYEINNFRYNENHKDHRPEHGAGAHDDLLFAVALAYFGLDSEAMAQHAVDVRRRPKGDTEIMLWELANGRDYDPLDDFDDDDEDMRGQILKQRIMYEDAGLGETFLLPKFMS